MAQYKVSRTFREVLASPRDWFDTRHSLRRVLFWSLVAVIFVPMLLIGSVVAYTALTDSRDASQNKLLTVAVLKEAAINRWMTGVTNRLLESNTLDIAARTLYEFERRPAFAEHLIARFRHDMFAIQGNAADFETLFVMDTGGEVKAATDAPLIGRNYANRDLFRQGQNGLYIEPLHYDDARGEVVLYIAVPVTDDDGAVTGVLAGKVNLEELKTILAETPGVGAQSETYLATTDGLILSPDLQPRPAAALSEGIQKGLDYTAGTGLYTNYAGEPVVGAYRPLGRLGVVLLAEQAQSEAFASLLRAATLLLILSAIIVIGAMALGYMLTNRIVFPLRLLTDMAEAISQGNLEQTVPLQREDEIGRLANAFNRMTFQLRDLINTLEERVQNRTQALQISAEVARKITAILDLDTLLFEVSNRIRDAFGYYYVQILLADEQGYLTTRAGSGEAGKKLTAQPYRVKLGARNPVGQAGLGQLQVANHLAEATGWQPHPLLPHTRSELAIPLRRGTGTIGVLDIQCGNEDAFSEEDITTLQSIADQLVIAVRNARLFRESEAARRQAERLLSELEETSRSLAQRSVQLQTAMQVSKATATILDTPLLLQETVNLIKEHFNFYYVGLFLTDETGEWAILKAGTGEAGRKQLAAGHRLKIEDASMIGWSIRHKQPRITGDVSQDEVHYVNPFLPDTRSEMALPLLSRETALGAISIQSTAQNAFTEEDIHVLQTVADQIAIALQNSRLFQQIQAIQARFEDLYHRAPTGYHTLAPDGTIREINDTELHMLGYDGHRHEIVGRRKLTDFLTGECQAYFESALQTLRHGKGVENAELTFVRRDGSLLPVMMNATPVRDATGEVHEIYASVQDISRLKEAETAREALLREADTLYRLGQQLLTAENEEEIYQASLQAIQTANPSRGIAILRYRQTADNINLELVALWNNPAQEWPPVPLGSTFSARELGLQDILLTGITVTATANTYADAFNANLIQLLDYLQIQSLVGTPLWSRGKVIGFVLVGHHTPTPFTPAEVRLFEGVARQMSVGIDNLTHLQEALHRATQLEAAAEVAKNTTAEVDLTLLLPRVVDLLQNSFGYYHISIFLVDEYRQHAVLQAATGDAGQQLLAENYRLPIDARSLVGASILEARARVIFNVTEDPHYLPHPLLPDTRAELTLPLIARGEVLGALDIQSVQSEDFQSGEVMALQTIADQVANAIHVARLFEQERAARQEVQDLHRRYLEREWSDFLQAEESLRQPFFTADGAPLPPAVARQWLPRLTPRIQQDAPPAPRPLSLPAQEDDEAPSQSALVSPLTLRNTSIGALALFDDADREWTDDDLSIIEAVSAQAALAVENARLIEETQRWALQLKTSAEISQVITASLDLNVLIGRSVNLIRRNFRFIATHLYLLNDGEGGAQTLLYQSDPDDDGDRPVTPRHISLNPDTLAGQAFRQQQTVVVQQNTPQHLSLLPAHPPGTQAALAIPLHVRQEAIGVLEIISDRPNPFTPDHVAVLEILATQVATSIGNARAYQEQQEVAEKLREVDRLKTQFLANMSHELRTPLNSIIGFSRVILKGIDGPLTELQKTDLTSIHQSGKHLLDLINNILDLAKIEAGKMELNFERVDLKPVLDAITATTIGLVKDKDIEVVEHVPDDLPLIEADETRVRQILLNLVSNAAKFTPQGRIVISARHTDRHVHIQVSDTGIGIAPEEQENIFKEFTQVDASTTRKAGGTGLGLPISRRFAELHGGTITVESRLNAGATFTLSLPIFQRPPDGTPPRPQATVAPAAEPASSTLLVIDGDPRVTDYYRQYLQNTGLDLVTLHTGEEALETVRTLQPKAILLDVLLPDTDGWSVLGALKENPHTAHIPVIICSIVEDHFRANQLGADGYLVKPILRQDLLGALEELDKRHRQLKRVLVIDDHADDVLLIRRILEAHECHVLEAANGMDGLDMLYANPPDLVILDLTMPQLDGFAVLDSMRDNPKTRHIPVIILTARDLTSEEESRLQAQADTILHKSTFADADLLQHVDRLLQPTPGT